jgi:VanZ family protein
VLAASLPTGLRRRYPIAVQALVTIVTGVWVEVLYSRQQQPQLEAFLVTLLVDYAAAVNGLTLFGKV